MSVDDREIERNVLRTLARCLRQIALHEATNAAVDKALEALLQALQRLAQSGNPVRVSIRGETVHVGSEVVRLDASTFDAAAFLSAQFTRLRLVEIAFGGVPRDKDLRALLGAWKRHAAAVEPWRIVGEQLPGITLVAAQATVVAEKDSEAAFDRVPLLHAFGQLAVVVERLQAQQRAGGELRLGRVRRAVQILVDASAGLDPALIALVRSRRVENAAIDHACAVASLVLVMGRRVGLRAALLADLSVAALLHVGACPSQDSADPVKRARLLARLFSPAMPNIVQRAVEVAAELGTAPIPGPLGRGAAARLLTVACTWDAWMRAGGVAHEDVMAALIAAPDAFDPSAVALLSATLGRHLPGDYVQLSSGECGLVLGGTSREDPEACRVLVSEAGGQRVVETGGALKILGNVPARLPAGVAIEPLLSLGVSPSA